MTEEKEKITLSHDLGSFEGFSFEKNCAIPKILTAEEVVNWDHDADGEAEFWPHGDCNGVSAVFKGKSSVTWSEIVALDKLLESIGDCSEETYAKIACEIENGSKITNISREDFDYCGIYCGQFWHEIEREAAWDLFETYYPHLQHAMESTPCDGVIFDPDRFINSPAWNKTRIEIGASKFLLVKSN